MSDLIPYRTDTFVAYVNVERKFGFIGERPNGSWFFHESDLLNASITALRIGQRVAFDRIETPKGPRAVAVEVLT